MNRRAYSVGHFIGWYTVWIVTGVAMALAVGRCLLGCAIPDVEDIHLAACMRVCNSSSEACLNAAEALCKLQPCDPKPFITCGHAAVDCLANCVAEVEAALK